MNGEDWEAAAGATCPHCQQVALRFRPEDGVCLDCAGKLDAKADRDRKRWERDLKAMQAHNARVTKRKGS